MDKTDPRRDCSDGLRLTSGNKIPFHVHALESIVERLIGNSGSSASAHARWISKPVVKQENKHSLKQCVASAWMGQHSEKIGQESKNLFVAVKRFWPGQSRWLAVNYEASEP